MKLVLNGKAPKEKYNKLYQLEVGDVFKIESDYETVMRRIEDYKPAGLIFRVYPINPGTDLYTMYGPDHSIVVSNTSLSDFIAPVE